jgi:tRNA pseudouridine55 synthase
VHGIFNVFKPLGLTSHDVVALVRRALHPKDAVLRVKDCAPDATPVGHAGTLDPAAEGVLLVCVGAATRVSEYLMRGTKTYCAEICLGVSTDTYDGEGRVTHIDSVEGVNRVQVEAVLATLTGRLDQKPPVYSAIKQDGVPLYRLARQGQTVESPTREVEVYEARLLAWRPPALRAEFRCSPGTYVRSLAHDLGQRLGCGAHLSHLVRTASGRFTIYDAVSLPVLLDAIEGGYGQEFIYTIDEALLGLDAVLVGADNERLLRHGGDWEATWAGAASLVHSNPHHKQARGYSLDGEMLGIVELREGRWWPQKVFV